jgi:hypothetical protein
MSEETTGDSDALGNAFLTATRQRFESMKKSVERSAAYRGGSRRSSRRR